MKTVYMDYAATTYVKPEVLEEMLPYFTQKFGNPSSFYGISRETKMAIDKARGQVANALNCDMSEVYFTGGGSEADNWAIKGIASAHRKKGNHIITTKIEHHAVLHTCEYLEKNGFEVTYLDVNEEGFIDLEELKNAITDKTILVSIMFANNEIGTIQPVKEIGAICRERKVLFHTDAVQAVGNVPVDVKEMNIDLLSLAGHKIYGPKGIGVLYIRKGVRIDNLIHGGGQERARRAGTENIAVGNVPVDVKEMNIDLLSLAGHKIYGPKGIGVLYIRKGVRIDNLIHGGGQERARRAGTENIAAVVGLGKAIELATKDLEAHMERISVLRDKLIDGILEKVPYSYLNGPRGDKRLPGNVNVRFTYIEGESILLSLDFEGICASSGSACTSGSLDPSHVLLAIGLPHELAHGSLRLT